MSFTRGIKESISNNNYLWMALWLLVLINFYCFLLLSQGFSIWSLLVFLITGSIGILIIKRISSISTNREEVNIEQNPRVDELMTEIKPICDDVFTDEINELTSPILNTVKTDFITSIAWLREDCDEFINQVEGVIGRFRYIINAGDSLSEGKSKLIQEVITKQEMLNIILEDMRKDKNSDLLDLDDFLQSQLSALQNEMAREKDVFYDYIKRLLMRLLENQENIDVDEYFDVDKISQQFRVMLGKAVESRLAGFQDGIIRELENLSADVVGKMQRNTMRLHSVFKDLEELLGKMKQENWDGTSLSIRQLNEMYNTGIQLTERSEEIMLTLAWQDILVEKRWLEMNDRLFTIRQQVANEMDESLISIINTKLADQIPGFTALAESVDSAVFYKAIMDSEIIYQLYQNDKMMDVIENGVYVLLEFIRPVESIAARGIRLSEGGIRRCKDIKNEVKSGEYNEEFQKVLSAAQNVNSQLLAYLDEPYPRGFYAFCAYPYIKQRPDNLSQAAWSVFVELTSNHNHNDDIYLLVALLLVLHKLRNKYIHPLKNTPLEIEDTDDIEIVRFAALKAVAIMLNHNFKGLTRLNFKSAKGEN
ncbi:hypothetical protein [Syntrophomonas palmitatica]|uniref:hypothetical protein n=1 Tax=Syntrophomonas palmitatica TaxID=402877 RepID=UPI0006CF529F|nr:hypothetical protein [Syntrophomonas palmitatica]